MSANTDPIFALQQRIKDLEYKLADTEACNGRLVEQVEQLTSELAEWRKDAERFIQLANFNNKKASEYFELHEQLVEKYGTENPVSDADITG